MGIGAVTGSEFAGLIVAVAVAVVVVAGRSSCASTSTRCATWIPSATSTGGSTSLRLVATGVLAVYTIGVAVAVYLNPGSEVGEAILFAIMAGAQAGLVTAFADCWVRRDERKQIDTGAAISA